MSPPRRVVVNGAAGRMGAPAVAAIGEADGSRWSAPGARRRPRRRDLPRARRRVVDFTRPDLCANALAILEAGRART
jgi:dihydrodipicolinate reductase